MSSTSDTHNGEQQHQQATKITFRFCRECSNMLYPQEDSENNTLHFTCRTCHYSEPPESACVYRNELTTTVGDTAGVTQDLGQDPTVGEDFLPEMCTLCGREILCEVCGKPTDMGWCLEVLDGDFETSVYDDAQLDNDAVSDPMSDDDNSEQLSRVSNGVRINQHTNGHAGRQQGQEQQRTQQNGSSVSLPRSKKPCDRCGEHDNVFFQSQQRTAETGMALYYVCTHCGHIWQDSGDKEKKS